MNRRTQVAGDLIHDRGRGPEVVGTRITIYNLLPHLLDPTATEAYICQMYELRLELARRDRSPPRHDPDRRNRAPRDHGW